VITFTDRGLTRLCFGARLRVPWFGAWVLVLECESIDKDPPTGKLVASWDGVAFSGTVDSVATGAFMGETTVTLIGGFGWTTAPKPLGGWLQNDAGLTGAAVARSLAKVVGETIVGPDTAFRAAKGRVAHARASQPASRTLTDLMAPGAGWWVGYDGITNVGQRPSVKAPPGVSVLNWSPSVRRAIIGAASIDEVRVGSVITRDGSRIPTDLRIAELSIASNESGQRYSALVLPV